jgi:thiosulfate dehydrogenase (quinone) large subunit
MVFKERKVKMKAQSDPKREHKYVVTIEDSPVTRALFSDVRLSWIWLILRLYVGYTWIEAGWAKLNNPAWAGDKAGTALTGFINGAVAKSTGAHPDVQSWYAWFLQHAVLPNAPLWSYVVSIGETLVGVALILGIFTGIAAFFGAFMNMNYLLAGTVSTNPILLFLAFWLVLAWKIAGWIGLDHWILPALGTPWRPGFVFKKPTQP